ncbi:MAG: DUF1127 domain-containing protein [Pseudomonas sp.]|uniref:DUF1127 domain-containing protein n=1 Tax=Pseudomonas sp. TaxID=306 RepID=UPI003BB797DA
MNRQSVVTAARQPLKIWPLIILRQLRRWAELARERRQLAMLSDGALKDLGLSRADIYQETERPFWHDPLKR